MDSSSDRPGAGNLRVLQAPMAALAARPLLVDVALAGGLTLLSIVTVFGGATDAIVKGPLTEEPGWRGFALPRMLGRWSPLAASLVLGVIWFAWHLPLLIQDLGGTQRPLVPYVIVVLSLSVICTWLWSATGRSVFIVIVFHSAVNSIGSHVVPAFASADQVTIWWIFAGLIAVVGALVASTAAFRRSSEPLSITTPARTTPTHVSPAIG